MSTVIAFIAGAFLSGVALVIVFGALHLEAEENAYRKGYEDGGAAMRKTAKVLCQTEHKSQTKLFMVDITGECSCCGATVVRNQYGRDECCPECDAELDWSEE